MPLVNNYRLEQDLEDREVKFYTMSTVSTMSTMSTVADEVEEKTDEEEEITGDTVGGKIVNLLQLIVQLLSQK